MRYNFLILSLLFLLPGALIFTLRRDLRRLIGLMALCSIPFAFTEFLFYPTYWEPVFLFDLNRLLGFGIEDVLFVVGLGAFTGGLYAFASRRRLEPIAASRTRSVAGRALSVLVVVFALVPLIVALGIPMIHGAVGVMIGGAGFMIARRRDLAWPVLSGGLLTTAVYAVLCWVLMLIIPDIFRLTWHAERFSNIYVLGIPLEELLYGFGAGTAATAFYPYVFCLRFTAPGVAVSPGRQRAQPE